MQAGAAGAGVSNTPSAWQPQQCCSAFPCIWLFFYLEMLHRYDWGVWIFFHQPSWHYVSAAYPEMLDRGPLALQINHLCVHVPWGQRGWDVYHTGSLSQPADGLDRCTKSAPSWRPMQHIWEAHAGKASPEVLPPQGLHTGSPPHAAGLLGPAFRVSPCREAERRLEISSSVLFSSKHFFSRFSSFNKAGKWEMLAKSGSIPGCSAQPPHCIPPASIKGPPIPSSAFSFLIP